MHWGVDDPLEIPVVDEVTEFLKYPVHVNAECQAVNALEGRTTKNYFRRLPNALPPGSRIEVAKLSDLGRLLLEVGIETKAP